MNHSQRVKAFGLFNQGFRPSEIYDEVAIKKHTLYWYFQLWKKEQGAARLQQEVEERAARIEEELEQEVSKRQQVAKQLASELHAIEMDLDQYRCYPKSLVAWWSSQPEINKVYSTPEEYQRALEQRRDYLRAKLKRHGHA